MQVGDADADRNGMMQARDTYVDRDEAWRRNTKKGNNMPRKENESAGTAM